MLSDADLLSTPLDDLTALARVVRDGAHGRRVTFSPKVFIPLTMLCRDKCGYCTFAKAPARVTAPYLLPEEVLAIAEAGKAAGCHEALFTLGERPELRYPVAAEWLAAQGYASTVDYLAAMCRLVVEETGLLPHANAGALDATELATLRPVAASQGMMLESLAEDLDAHRGAPDKVPARRLATLEFAGELAIPFTTGILVGIGDTRADQLAGLRAIAASHARHGHVQEVIVQNFLPKAGTAMFRAEPCAPEDLVWAIAAARLVLPPDIHVQAPPNLSDELGPLLAAGIDDWGGVSPVTADHVNPERAWPALDILREATEAAGHTLAPRLTIYPTFAHDPARWLDPALHFPVMDVSDAEGLAREDLVVLGGRGAPAPAARRARPATARGAGRDQRRHRPRCGGRGAGRRGARPGGGRGRDRDALQRPRPRGAHGGRGGRRPAPAHCRRGRDLRAQPQHQLHERLHLQVPLLRLLQGPALAQPARRALPAGTRRDHAARRRGRRRGGHRGLPAGRHPPQLRRRLLRARARSGAGRVDRHPHPRLHRARR